MLVTHGTNSNADSWVVDLAKDIKIKANSDWDVVTLDWRVFAGGAHDPECTSFCPNLSANNGIDIGESVGKWLEAVGLDNYENVHLLSHSSGSWLVDGLADQLDFDDPTRQIHLTVFDAFTPPLGLINRPGNAIGPVLGESADWKDHFIDSSFLNLLYTQETLPNFLNVDVSSLLTGTINPVTRHAWPYQWYHDTVMNPNVGTTANDFWRLLGFPNSLEWREQQGLPSLPQHSGLFQEGTLLRVMENGDVFELHVSVPPTPISFLDTPSVPSATGTITYDPNGSVILTTGSPVILTLFLELPNSANMFEFDFEFLSAADGVLSAYFDGDLLFEFSTEDIPNGFGLLNTGDIWLNDTAVPGNHTLILRVDPLGVEQASASISNLEFAFLDLLPVIIPPALPGDYNGNGVVDAADYTVWRDQLGQAIALPNETVTPGMVTQADYDEWKANFGMTAGSGAGAVSSARVPEPSTTAITFFAWLILYAFRRRP